jgi:hypothetical protein
VIAHFGEATGVTARLLPDQATQQLAILVARRRQIVDMTVQRDSVRNELIFPHQEEHWQARKGARA